ncbi:MAG: GNAT family N-acetyltransferase [Chitinophagaceae bacterium]|nr:GNAT family N-acetyltransferase [Chitinophagaceae bacterium]
MSEKENNIIIREAVRSDVKAIMQLIRELALYEKAPEEVTVSEKQFEECGFGNSPVWWALVAEFDGKLIGMALYYIRYSTWKGPKMYLEDLIVNEKWRGKGVGKMLFDGLIKKAKEKNWNGMSWQVLTWNESAIQFYKKYEGVQLDDGWTNGSLEFQKTKSY